MDDPRCPVCGEGFEGERRHCPRCSTPHHIDCWDYVPGCAVFACADAAETIRADEWPRAHRLVLLRTRILDFGARLIFVGLLGEFLAQASGAQFAQPSVLLATLVILAGIVCHSLAYEVLRLIAFFEGNTVLERLQREGDQRLRRAIEARCAAPSRVPTWEVAFAAFFLQLAVVNFGAPYGEDPTGVLRWDYDYIRGNLVLAALLSAVFYTPLWSLANRMIGSQRVLANRLAVAKDPPKPPPPRSQEPAP